MTNTDWELRIDQMVKQNISYWWQIYADAVGRRVVVTFEPIADQESTH